MFECASDPMLEKCRELFSDHREVGWEMDFVLSEGHWVPGYCVSSLVSMNETWLRFADSRLAEGFLSRQACTS